MEDAKVKIKQFVSRFFRKHELQDDDDIFSLGYVNSLFAMQLVMFLEKEFHIRVVIKIWTSTILGQSIKYLN